MIPGVVAAICKKLQIPHFTSAWKPIDSDFNGTESFTRNLFPHPKKYSEALAEIVKSFRWKNFAVIYDEEEKLVKLQDMFTLFSTKDIDKQPIKFYKLPKGSDDYKPILKKISKSDTHRVMIDCTIEKTYSVLKQSIAIGMNSDYDVSFSSINI